VNVLNDFLDLEKFQAGLVALELEELSLSELMRDLRDELSSRQEPVNFDFNNYDEVLETRIKVDPSRILFALSTIALAIDCFSEGELTYVFSRLSDRIRIVIIASNIPEHIEEAFLSPYVFLSDARLKSVVPSGLSLSLSRAILSAHNASVHIERTHSDCRVELFLPRA
jgi:signal transduction histidine kinase